MFMKYSQVLPILVLLLLPLVALGSVMDSLRMETKKGRKYIIHRVESKETLFSISRRYGVKVADILDANAGTENGIQIYQELWIPYGDTGVVEKKASPPNQDGIYHVVQQGETLYAISKKYGISIDSLQEMNQLRDFNLALGDSLMIGRRSSSAAPVEETKDRVQSDSAIHVVGPSETLYSISKRYGISIDSLKMLNALSSNTLDIGQRLKIRKDAKMPTKEVKPKPPVEVKPKVDTIFVKTDTSRFKTRVEKIGNVEKITEEGFAMKIAGTADTKKYLALHRTVPIGTVLEVKNQMNNRSIFARVVGKLPETGVNKTVLIRISDAAYEKLAALDAKIPVQIGYVHD